MFRRFASLRDTAATRSFGALVLVAGGFAAAGACSSSSSPAAPDAGASDAGPGGGPVTGAQDTHCQGQAPQPVNPASCHVTDAGPPHDAGTPADASADVGADETSASGFGATMCNAAGDDDDCKYHVIWSIIRGFCLSDDPGRVTELIEDAEGLARAARRSASSSTAIHRTRWSTSRCRARTRASSRTR
ncbi:MAG: hypothetical protein ACHREM_11915 [Polyangiales bacterium]